MSMDSSSRPLTNDISVNENYDNGDSNNQQEEGQPVNDLITFEPQLVEFLSQKEPIKVEEGPLSTSPIKPKKTKKMHLLAYEDIPDWMKDNDCLKRHYRPPLGNGWLCLKSIFSFHTETINIWTHLLGCSVFMILGAYTYLTNHHMLSWDDFIMFGVYFLSIITCLAFSSIFHIFNCHSKRAFLSCKRLDYCGISFLISGSFISWTYYAFHTDMISKAIYLSIVSVIGLTIAIISLLKKFGSSDFRAIRTTVYIVFGLSVILPVVHYYFFHKDYVPISFFSMFSFGFYYILGGIIYAIRIPERFFPGRLDVFGHSHQIFHILIIVAAWIHLNNICEIAFLRLTPKSIIGNHTTMYDVDELNDNSTLSSLPTTTVTNTISDS